MPKFRLIQTIQQKKPPSHTALIGVSCIVIGITILVGMLTQLSGQQLITIDRRDPIYSSIIARQIARDAPMSPFVINYPVIHNRSIDAQIQAYITNIMNLYMNERSKRQDVTNDEQLQIIYQTRWLDSMTFSVDFTSQKHRPDKIWDQHTETLTFNRTTGAIIQPGTLIKNSLNLANILYDYRRVHNTPRFSSAELMDLLDLDASKIKSAIPYRDVIGFTYIIGGKTDTVAIKKSLLQGIIEPNYLRISTGSTFSQPVFTDSIHAVPSRDEQVNPAAKKLALTFDDGPNGETPRLLDALRKYRAHATFFVVGKNVVPGAPTIKRIVNEGNEIGNHTWGHPDLRALSDTAIKQQINDTQAAVIQVSGQAPSVIRPPYGSMDSRVQANLQGLRPVLWTVDTEDWSIHDTTTIYNRIMAGAGQNSIILMHDIHAWSVDAAIRAVRQLRADGWQLVTVSQL